MKEYRCFLSLFFNENNKTNIKSGCKNIGWKKKLKR